MNRFAFLLIVAGVIIFGFYYWYSTAVPRQNPVIAQTPALDTKSSFLQFKFPMTRRDERTFKKPFGIFVTPQNSPVKPERFYGYHTGIDFDPFPEEENKDVPIFAVCDGTLVLKNWASGYGGVVAERCVLDGQPITIIYGHLNLASVAASVGDNISAGAKLGVLGKGYSLETDGERKHLHFGIHKGSGIDILGYISRPEDLKNWLDPQLYFR